MRGAEQAERFLVLADNLVEPFMTRVQARRGNGLTRAMNQTLRSYPEIPAIIRRTVSPGPSSPFSSAESRYGPSTCTWTLSTSMGTGTWRSR